MTSSRLSALPRGCRGWFFPLKLATAIVLLTTTSTPSLRAAADDFNDGNDSGWLKSTHPSTITFPADAYGGKAYRLQGTPATGSDTNARVFCIFTNRLYTNFYASVDVISWNTNQDANLVVGLLGRVNNNEALPDSSPLKFPGPLDPSKPNGISFNARLHNSRSYTGPANAGPLGSRDQTSIWGLVNAYGTFQLGNPAAVSQTIGFRWVPGRAYRLVLSCTNTYGAAPTFFTASLYDVNDLTKPLMSLTGDDTYNVNYLYLPLYGYPGVFAYHLSDNDYDPTVDITFDNFYVAEIAPTSVAAPGIPHGVTAAPQVVNRIPASFANFHPAAAGISFNATTLTTTNTVNTNAVRLWLNGVDVSADLAISGPGTNLTVSYSKLASNTVYDASIALEDALGRRTTNEWTFDTFTDAFLASTAVKVIEAEDFNFEDGQFINDPPASGYFDYDPTTDFGTQINNDTGYVDRMGIQGIDYFDRDSSGQLYFAQYRHYQGVGTQQGNFGAALGASSGTPVYTQSYETQRSKYSSVNPSLHEYVVTRTEGGEWLNYTRQFNGTKYHAYLRVSCGLAQPVRLDHIASGPATNYLGTFNVPSTFWLHNYRYVPLLAADGTRAVVNLNGPATLRLTMDSPQNEATKQGLSMNYLLLLPPAPQVVSSSTVNGSYSPEPNVLLDNGAKRITVPRSGGTRFYRINWTQPATIKGIAVSGSNVVLSYQ